ncbi:hypothetical protein FKM82_016611 [Ascaphus truei]
MNQQPQQKASNKRTGKRISFFNEQDLPVASKEPQLKEQHFHGSGVRLPISQASEFSKSEVFTSAASNSMLNTVMYTQDRADAMRLNQQPVPGKWNLPERNDASWQAHPAGMWTRNAASYNISQKGMHAAVMPTYYNHHETLKRSQDKGVGVSQLDLYGDALQQMMSQKAQLEQHTLARQQAHLNSILQAQQQQQQQQQQNQHLSLQSFQMAFGHQGPKQALSELFHVFPEAPSNATYAAQQKQQTALPQMQLFENFYPSQQQQQQAAYGMQQAGPMSQSHGAAQHKMHMMSQFQHAPPTEEFMKALAEQKQQTVLPKTQIPLPRRSRRLSKEGLPPVPPGGNQAFKAGEGLVNNPYTQQQYVHSMQHQAEVQECYNRYHHMQRDAQMASQESHYGNPPELDRAPLPHNGRAGELQAESEQSMVRTNEPVAGGAITGGVIQTTRRKRRTSQEANLVTLAQKAVELASLQNTKDGDAQGDKKRNQASKSNIDFAGAPSSKRARGGGDLRPLVMPVSVPVKMEMGKEKGEERRTATPDRDSSPKPSVIVTRHRAGQTNNSEPPAKVNETSPSEEGQTPSRKPKQRPRPEPLFIPPKAGTFIVPVVYSNITPYQSHLRSPVRVSDHLCDRNFELPPYTPPPILSPVRGGSGLYFNAIMSASAHSMPPPITPKSSTRSLLRSNSVDDMPPVLTAIGDATPVSIEPRINIGSRFQAEIPDLRDGSLASAEKYKADLVWWPWEDSGNSQGKVEELLIAACSSIMPGGGTNQELTLHYLHEAKGNIVAALTKLLLKKPRRNRNHPLADYHYSGSDRWTVSEKKLFNKGMAIYKKDFLLVQKLIKTKTVAQCVEFYYTYKKQVKIGRNGMLIFGDVEATADEKNPREDSEVDIKSSHRLAPVIPPRREVLREEATEPPPPAKEAEEIKVQVKLEEEEEEDKRRATPPTKVTQTLQPSEIANVTLILRNQEPDTKVPEKALKPRGRRPRKKFPPDGTKKPEELSKTQSQEGNFPCKKCGR